MSGGNLRLEDGFSGAGDDVYAALMQAHDGLSDEASAALNARLVLLLANHVGDPDILAEAIRLARNAAQSQEEASGRGKGLSVSRPG